MAQGFNKKGQLRETPRQHAILEILAIKGILAWRNQKGIIPIRRGRVIVGQRKSDKWTNGMPDILAIHRGVFIGIEVKTEDGVQSDDQKRWQASIEQAGGLYILAVSWNDVEKSMTRHFGSF